MTTHDLIPLPKLAQALAAEGYQGNPTYAQLYHTVTRGHSGGVQDRTGHWFYPRSDLERLAKRLKLTRATKAMPIKQKPWVTMTKSGPVYETTAEFTVGEYITKEECKAKIALPLATRSTLIQKLAPLVERMEDTGHKHWPEETSTALSTMCSMVWVAIFAAKRKQEIDSDNDDFDVIERPV